MSDLPPFPEAVSSDSDDVSWALETGRSMWAQGELQEALRWLKRAADTASESEDDMRSLELAKAAAELRNVVGDGHSQAPPPSQGRAPASMPAPASSAPAPRSQPVRGPLPPPPPAPPGRAAGSGFPPSHPASAGPPASAAPPPAPPPPTPSRPASAAPPPPKRHSVRPASARADAAVDDDRATLVDQRDKSLPSRAKALQKHEAIRVALQMVEGKPNVCVVLPLRVGDRPGPGMREALLIPLDDQGSPFAE